MSSVLKQIISAYPHPDKLKIKDLAHLGKLVDAMVDKGPDLLQVITDFDFTLTKSHLPDGKRTGSAPSVMNNSPLMSEEFRKNATALYNKYHPIEIDHNMTIEQKIPLILEWYEKRRDLVVSTRIKRSLITQMVSSCNVFLRDGAKQSLTMLNETSVPVLIFSAGNGDILEEIMKRDAALFPNVHIISNFMKYDANGCVCGYKSSTLLHVFNKNEHAVKNCSYFNDLSHRPNALVMGDSIGDVTMAVGIQNPGAILKIGFLNEKIEEHLESFKDNFDVVLIDDQTFDFVNILLRFALRRTV